MNCISPPAVTSVFLLKIANAINDPLIVHAFKVSKFNCILGSLDACSQVPVEAVCKFTAALAVITFLAHLFLFSHLLPFTFAGGSSLTVGASNFFDFSLNFLSDLGKIYLGTGLSKVEAGNSGDQ